MPIRVLQVLGGLEAGGAETFVMNLYRKIDKSRVQFDFVKHITHKGVFEDEIHQMGGKIYQCPRYTGKNHFAYCKWWNNFFEEHSEYHVIHGHVRSTAAIYLKIAKKHEFMVKLFAEYHKSNPNSKLLLVGDGDLFAEVKQQISHLGIDNAVVMAGSKTNTEDYYQAMDIFVFPSLWEGLPVSVVEAQANGLPCLLSDVITHDVDLTDQVHYLPLNEEKMWLKEIEAVRSQKRTAATAENLRKLQPFDAAVVAQNLQEFYLEVDKGTRK